MRHFVKRTCRTLLLLVLVAAASGCSIKLAYNNLDRFIRWGVSDYVELDRAQKDYLQTEIRKVLYWHRTTQLPLYSDYMMGLADQLSDGVSAAQIEGIFEQFFVWGDAIEDKSLPIAVHILASLSEEQVAGLPEKLEASNVEIEEAEVGKPLEKVQAEWAKEFEDTLERFTGRLDVRQRNYIGRRAQAYEPERELWAAYRRRWQADFVALLEERQAPDFGERFAALSKAREDYYGPEYTRVSEANIALGRDVAAYVLSNLSEKQAERFRDALVELGEDFAELAAQA